MFDQDQSQLVFADNPALVTESTDQLQCLARVEKGRQKRRFKVNKVLASKGPGDSCDN